MDDAKYLKAMGTNPEIFLHYNINTTILVNRAVPAAQRSSGMELAGCPYYETISNVSRIASESKIRMVTA